MDTNLLLVYFLGLYDIVSGYQIINSFRYTKGKFTTRDFDLLSALIRRFDSQITTPHILTEVSNMLGHLTDPARETCFGLMKVIVPSLDERSIPAENLTQDDIFIKFGLTDTGIRKVVTKPCLVLTDDYRLSGYLEKVGVDALNFHHIRFLS